MASLISPPDELGMSLDAVGALVATQRLGRDVPHAPRLLRLALARLAPKRPTDCRQVAPTDTADATRWRRSTGKVVGMSASLPGQRPAIQHSF